VSHAVAPSTAKTTGWLGTTRLGNAFGTGTTASPPVRASRDARTGGGPRTPVP